MTKIKDEKENSTEQKTNNIIEKNSNKIKRTISISNINRKTSQFKKNFLTLNKTESKNVKKKDSNRRLSLNPNTILKQATTTIITTPSLKTQTSTRRKSISNPFSINDTNNEKLKKFKSKIDYLKTETLNNYDQTLKQIKNEFDNKKKVSKLFFYKNFAVSRI
jgi:hypothetical protein